MIPNAPRRWSLATLLAAASIVACTPPDAAPSLRVAAAYLDVVAAEDARPEGGPELDVLLAGTRSRSPTMRAVAVRGLGRLERPELIDEIAPLLTDRSARVRTEAANALAQAVHAPGGQTPASGAARDRVVDLLAGRATSEADPAARAALARSLGRSTGSPASRARATDAILSIAGEEGDGVPTVTLTGVALGLESLARGLRGRGLPEPAIRRLRELARHGVVSRRPEDTRVRTVAYIALAAANAVDRSVVEDALDDPEVGPRVVIARAIDQITPSQRQELLRRLLAHRSLQSPLEAVRAIGRQRRSTQYCAALFAAAAPEAGTAVRLMAFESLATPCPDVERQVALLRAAAAGLGPGAWRVQAGALAALAAVRPEEAAPLLPALAAHENPFARAHAARIAGAVGDTAAARALLGDANANVRTAAAASLAALEGRAADAALLPLLGGDDPQLLMTVADALRGTELRDVAAEELLSAFERISEARRETWRDARLALLERIGEVAEAEAAGRLRPYLRDYDERVAAAVATLIEAWTGTAAEPAPEPLPRVPLPTPEEYAALVGARVVLHMEGGGRIVIALHPGAATTNVARFVRLVESGWFDGLTFHRWAPNFVIQGGSPGANEYQGDAPYSRDEVGLRVHWRGTVGISTRGRDTGDAQIFVNLVDNPRLDHDYTIVGTVVEGMEVVDAVLEGSVIERAEMVRD